MFKTLRFSRDDFHATYSLGCTVLGIGSLGFSRNFAQAGPLYATIALLIMSATNIYATNALSHVMVAAPKHLTTFGDMGEWVYNSKKGRYVVIFAQFGTCLMVPIAFLVLGGSIILPKVFKSVVTWNANTWIPLMAASLSPFVLIKSLKEASVVALIGALGTALAVLLAMIDSTNYATLPPASERTNFTTQPTALNVMSVFGTMSLAYGAAVVIPAIQREHKTPTNMPKVITLVLLAVTAIYFVIGLLGYHTYGCASPSNLLMKMENKTLEIIGLSGMFIHIAIAYAVVLNPALFIFERFVYGFHTVEEEKSVDDKEVVLLEAADKEEEEEEWTMTHRLKSYALRLTVVVIQVFLAMLLQGSFDDLADFIGATTMTLSCMILPVAMYLQLFRNSLHWSEKAWCIFIIVLSTVLGLLSAYLKLKVIANTIVNSKPFVSPEAKEFQWDYQYCEAQLDDTLN